MKRHYFEEIGVQWIVKDVAAYQKFTQIAIA